MSGAIKNNTASIIDDSYSLVMVNQLVRSASARVEDIHLLRQHVDLRNSKLKNWNLDMFEEIRQREIQRINIENVSLGKLAGYKVKEDEKVVRAQQIKSCKRIFKLFWNQFEDEEES